MKFAATDSTLDRWAIFVSGLCVVHCLAIPATVVLLPAISDPLAREQTLTHWLLLAVALPISALALGSGYRRHRSLGTLILGIVGLVLLTLGVAHWLGEDLEVPLTVAGGIALIIAHLLNLRHRH
ncbi:MAG: MerC domain-containing protein [Pseudomonadales bacterium]